MSVGTDRLYEPFFTVRVMVADPFAFALMYPVELFTVA